MTDARQNTMQSRLERLVAELPGGRDGDRTLFVVPDGAAVPAGAARWDPTGEGARPQGPFDCVVCAEALQASPHPANLVLALWEGMDVGGTLLLHSRVLTRPDQSTFARFVAANAGVGDTEWLPGRMALRWTLETNGFDPVRWIDPGSSMPEDDDAYLVATRTGRTPSLVLSTPTPVDGPSQRGGQS